MTHAEISLNGPRGKVLLDGQDVSTAVHSLELTAEANGAASLTLNLIPKVITVDAKVGLLLSPGVAAILKAAGWLPPARPDTATEDERMARGGYNPADEGGAP